mmetsp:Transcript_35481/g.86207  ORF Transcript_35481/g.86207 Transcript_35481/m.86207 type:complete len:106 (+) Transcript_35481:136-453(+)
MERSKRTGCRVEDSYLQEPVARTSAKSGVLANSIAAPTLKATQPAASYQLFRDIRAPRMFVVSSDSFEDRIERRGVRRWPYVHLPWACHFVWFALSPYGEVKIAL